ncbi:MAG: hypothetical protein ACOC80_15815 [Petrotogales bacterium]
MKNDFIIQIIGAERSGKTKLVSIISNALEKFGVIVEHSQFHNSNDFSEIKGKNCFITEFTTDSERDIESESGEIEDEDSEKDFGKAFVRAFGESNE